MELDEVRVVFPAPEIALTIPLNVPLTHGGLIWRPVHNIPREENGLPVMATQERLLLYDPITGNAYDGNYGETRRCRMLQDQGSGYNHIPGAFVNVRCSRKTAGIRLGIYDGEGPVYQSIPEEGWVPISCPNCNEYSYSTPGAVPLRATLTRIDNFKVLRLTAPYAQLAILLEPDSQQPVIGRQLQKALVGEVVLAYHLRPRVDGAFDFVNDDDRRVAIKNIKHFNRDGIPLNTEDIRRQHYQREDPIKEIEIMHYIASAVNTEMPEYPRGHPNVIHFDTCLVDQQNVYMIMPFINSRDLFAAVHEHSLGPGYFTDINARQALKQIFSGLRFMHSIGVCHMDISTENVFVHRMPDGSYRFILADLGQAMVHDLKADHATRLDHDKFALLRPYEARKAPGKKMYYVPETFLANYPAPFSGFKVDMWQIGILSMVVITRSVPFHPDNTSRRIEQWLDWIRRGHLGHTRVFPSIGSPAEIEYVRFAEGYPRAFDLVSTLIRINPDARVYLYDTHPFFA